jgi:CO/xanthine dehydrogenase Mo-binding subunit
MAVAMIATIPAARSLRRCVPSRRRRRRYTLSVGTCEFGNGTSTVHTQLVASELNVTADRVRLRQSDTDACEYDTGAFGSAGTVVAGLAVQTACRDPNEDRGGRIRAAGRPRTPRRYPAVGGVQRARLSRRGQRRDGRGAHPAVGSGRRCGRRDEPRTVPRAGRGWRRRPGHRLGAVRGDAVGADGRSPRRICATITFRSWPTSADGGVLRRHLRLLLDR